MKTDDLVNHITIIADNGGGLTLQIDDSRGQRWQHTYPSADPADYAYMCDASDIVADVMAYITDGDLSSWEGNEVDEYGWTEPSDDDIRNGGYRVLTINDIINIDPEADPSASVCRLRERLLDAPLEGQDLQELLDAAVRTYVERN